MFFFIIHAFLDAQKGISLKWVDNYNTNFMNQRWETNEETDTECPLVRGFDLFVNIPMYQRYCTWNQISIDSGVFSNFMSRSRPLTPHPIWAKQGGFKLYTKIQNDAQETSISISNMNSEVQPSAPPNVETNVQPSTPIMKLDLPPSYDEVMNKY